MKVLFVAGFGPIISDVEAARNLYIETLGLPLEEDNQYFSTGQIEGIKHFALWPLSQAAESCFGSNTWPNTLPVPNTWIEYDVEDVEAASRELEAAGYRTLVSNRAEPWGQIVTRFLSPEGILTGLTCTPSMRQSVPEVSADKTEPSGKQ